MTFSKNVSNLLYSITIVRGKGSGSGFGLILVMVFSFLGMLFFESCPFGQNDPFYLSSEKLCHCYNFGFNCRFFEPVFKR